MLLVPQTCRRSLGPSGNNVVTGSIYSALYYDTEQSNYVIPRAGYPAAFVGTMFTET